MLVIGEKINGSNKSIAQAIVNRDEAFLADIARAQAAAGADYIDVNVGSGHGSHQDEIRAMEWLVSVVQAATDKPLTIDSDSPDIIEAAIKKYHGEQLIINSVTAEPDRLQAIGPLAAKQRASLVALAMGAEGIPGDVAHRLAACEHIMNYLTGLGMAPGQVLFDALVLPLSVDPNQGLITLETIAQIKHRYPDAKTVVGLSNISYGLPQRPLVNRTFMLMAVYAGLDAVIIDPLDTKAMSLVKVSDLIMGKDPSCRQYLRAHRKGQIVD